MAKGAFVESEILESDAFLSLSGIAAQVFLLILLKRQFEFQERKKGKQKRICLNCNSLTFTYIEAWEKYGITQPRLTRAIDDLLAKGFITCKHNGGTYKQDKSVYALTDKYLLWKPKTVFEKRKKDSAQRGFRKPKKQK